LRTKDGISIQPGNGKMIELFTVRNNVERLRNPGAPASNEPVYIGSLLTATTTINFTPILQHQPFDFYTAAVSFSRTQKSKGEI
jgi:hypothetical protein